MIGGQNASRFKIGHAARLAKIGEESEDGLYMLIALPVVWSSVVWMTSTWGYGWDYAK